MRAIAIVSLAVVTLSAGAGVASATTIAFDHCAILELCSQVTVTTTLVGTEIDVDVLDVPGSPAFGLFGDTGANRAFGFHVVDPDAGVAILNVTDGFSYAGAGVTGMASTTGVSSSVQPTTAAPQTGQLVPGSLLRGSPGPTCFH